MRQIDYQQKYQELLQENIDSVRRDIDAPYMTLKIENYGKKFGLPIAFVRRKIMIDNIFALNFAKDPSKQSYNQTLAREFIAENPNINFVEQLPSSGKGAMFAVNGILKTNDDLTPQEKAAKLKSIDFHWTVTGKSGCVYQIYASHKYTKDEGGAQDNQYSDLCKFMENARPNTSDRIYYLAIGDGEYYQRRRECGGRMKRIDYMNQQYGATHCIALTSNDIDAFTDRLLRS